ncbi:MAG: PcfJ domain-containing protein [Lachnospiraceae bacterium]|nr:PcfJ domain-containing protein [Lachnospiraceae bacterium]
MAREAQMINVKDLILDKEELEKLNLKTTQPRNQHRYNFHVVMESGCDFAIERIDSISRKKARLVFIVSQEQYYIEEGSLRKRLSRSALKSFLAGLGTGEKIVLNHVNWLDHIENTGRFRSVLAGIALHRLYMLEPVEMIRHGDFFVLNDPLIFCKSSFGSERITDKDRDYSFEFSPAVERNKTECFKNFWDKKCMHREMLGDREDYSYQIDFYSGINPQYVSVDCRSNVDMCHYEELQLSMYEMSPALYRYMLQRLSERRGVSKKKLLKDIIPDLETQDSMLFQSFPAMWIIQQAMGIDTAKRAIDMYISGNIRDIIPAGQLTVLLYGFCVLHYAYVNNFKDAKVLYNFRNSSFLEYLFVISEKQGYGRNMNLFLFQWGQALFLQEMLEIKHVEKYPKHLASKCVELMTKTEESICVFEKKIWEAAVEYAKPLEYAGEKYRIIVPKSPADLERESEQQGNCVRSYESRILRHETRICFLRSAELGKEDDSIVTIEVDKENRVLQCKGKYNSNPMVSLWEFILEWEKARDLSDWTGKIPEELFDELGTFVRIDDDEDNDRDGDFDDFFEGLPGDGLEID